jgi:hypothetical protein
VICYRRDHSRSEAYPLMLVLSRRITSKHQITRDNMAEGVRFENPDAPETISLDLILSDRSQSLTDETEAGEDPIKTDRAR